MADPFYDANSAARDRDRDKERLHLWIDKDESACSVLREVAEAHEEVVALVVGPEEFAV